MPSRRQLIGFIVGSVSLSSIVGSSAFQQSTSSRDVSVSVSGDDTEEVCIYKKAIDGQYAEINDGKLELEFGELFGPSGGDGINANSVTEFDQVFGIENRSQNENMKFYAEQTSPEGDKPKINIYDSFSEEKKALTKENQANLSSGTQLLLGVRIDTTGVSVQESPYKLDIELITVGSE